MNRRQRVDLMDVARAAGVSKSTASRALRREPRVSGETTERVMAIAASLGYVRDLRAAELASTAPTTVGLLLRGSERSFYGEIAARVQAATDARGIDLLIVNGGDDHSAQVRAIDNLLGHGVAGIMIASGRASIPAVEYAASFVPTVLVGMESSHDAIDSVSIDNSSETEMADQVIAAGHRRVAVTASDPAESFTLHQRTERYRNALEAAGAEVTIVHGAGDGDALARELRNAIQAGVTAVMTGDDPTAVEVLELLDSWGIRSPTEVSVTGFDAVGVYRSPLFGLATMRQPVEQMASAATELMMERLGESQKPAIHATYPGEYVQGRTLGHPSEREGE